MRLDIAWQKAVAGSARCNFKNNGIVEARFVVHGCMMLMLMQCCCIDGLGVGDSW